MSVHKATIRWQADEKEFTPATYNRDHRWEFEGGQSLGASAAPAYRGNPALVDPEEAFTASLASCHMLTFLYLAAVKGITVTGYVDEAEGHIGKNQQGRMAVLRVMLRPRIEFAGTPPDEATLQALHEQAHKHCFIANSVTTEIEFG